MSVDPGSRGWGEHRHLSPFSREIKSAASPLGVEFGSRDFLTIVTAKSGVYLAQNAYWDGVNWQRLDAAQPAYLVLLDSSGTDRIRLSLVSGLTEAEWAALDLLGQGLENRQIADQTGDSESSVKSTVRSLLSKLRCRNRTEAGIFAHRQAPALQGLRPHPGSELAQ